MTTELSNETRAHLKDQIERQKVEYEGYVSQLTALTSQATELQHWITEAYSTLDGEPGEELQAKVKQFEELNSQIRSLDSQAQEIKAAMDACACQLAGE